MRGTTLSEVLIAVLVLGIGMLGIASLQATSLRNSQSSLERSQAVIATYAIIDAMRANRNDALAGAYNITNTCRSEEHTSELQSLMRISYAVFCLKKKKNKTYINKTLTNTQTYITTHNSMYNKHNMI